MGDAAHQLKDSSTNCPTFTTTPFSRGFVHRASSDTRGLGRTTAGRLGALRLSDAQRANAVPHLREGTMTASHPLGEVQGRAQGFRHGRQGTLGSQAARQRHTAENVHSRCCAAFALGALPTEAEAARPPKGCSFLPRGWHCWAHLVFRGRWRGKAGKAIGLVPFLPALPPTLPTCGQGVYPVRAA